jgi:hypothetical protein
MYFSDCIKQWQKTNGVCIWQEVCRVQASHASRLYSLNARHAHASPSAQHSNNCPGGGAGYPDHTGHYIQGATVSVPRSVHYSRCESPMRMTAALTSGDQNCYFELALGGMLVVSGM